MPSDRDSSLPREVDDLTDAALRGTISLDEAHRLERLILENSEARRRYLEFIDDSYSLSRWAEGVGPPSETARRWRKPQGFPLR